MAINGTTPEPPPMSWIGPGCSGRHTNQPPTGPLISSGSPTVSTFVKYGDTSPLGTNSTVSSICPAVQAEPIEYTREA